MWDFLEDTEEVKGLVVEKPKCRNFREESAGKGK
jgi:hypothetical protein